MTIAREGASGTRHYRRRKSHFPELTDTGFQTQTSLLAGMNHTPRRSSPGFWAARHYTHTFLHHSTTHAHDAFTPPPSAGTVHTTTNPLLRTAPNIHTTTIAHPTAPHLSEGQCGVERRWPSASLLFLCLPRPSHLSDDSSSRTFHPTLLHRASSQPNTHAIARSQTRCSHELSYVLRTVAACCTASVYGMPEPR